MKEENTKTNIRVELFGEIEDAYKTVKEFYMLENNTDVIRTLIREKYLEITKGEKE